MCYPFTYFATRSPIHSIEDLGGRTALSLSANNKAIAALIQKTKLDASISQDDIADDGEFHPFHL
jgi:hypothetical protein